jgi:hypothetical protein
LEQSSELERELADRLNKVCWMGRGKKGRIPERARPEALSAFSSHGCNFRMQFWMRNFEREERRGHRHFGRISMRLASLSEEE